MIKRILFLSLIVGAAFVYLTGCASMYTAKTKVHVEIRPDGTCIGDYSSDKEQQGLEAAICGGNIKVDKSGTLESIVAAIASQQAQIARVFETLLPLAASAAKAGS